MAIMNTQKIIDALARLRDKKPLVVNITNYVVMNNTANALLALGASPIMAHSRQEMAEMMRLSNALVINIGTLDSAWNARMDFALEQANRHNNVVILDPVGCGASQLRTRTASKIAAAADKLIIRGNASEIIALAGNTPQSRGVDALDSSDEALSAAYFVAQHYQCHLVISGETDHVITKDAQYSLNNGHAMMPFVTGMGCTHTALIGAFAAIGEETGLAATAILGVAGEIAAAQSAGPGSLQVQLLDALYLLDEQTLRRRLKLTVKREETPDA